MIGKVQRNNDGTWATLNGKGVFSGEDAEVLDVMFGYKQTPQQRKKALEAKYDAEMATSNKQEE